MKRIPRTVPTSPAARAGPRPLRDACDLRRAQKIGSGFGRKGSGVPERHPGRAPRGSAFAALLAVAAALAAAACGGGSPSDLVTPRAVSVSLQPLESSSLPAVT